MLVLLKVIWEVAFHELFPDDLVKNDVYHFLDSAGNYDKWQIIDPDLLKKLNDSMSAGHPTFRNHFAEVIVSKFKRGEELQVLRPPVAHVLLLFG